MEFFLNVFSDKIFIIKRTWTCHLLCKIPGCYHSASNTHVRDIIFQLSPIHASVIYQIPWIRWIHWIQWKFLSIWEKLQYDHEGPLQASWCTILCWNIPHLKCLLCSISWYVIHRYFSLDLYFWQKYVNERDITLSNLTQGFVENSWNDTKNIF